MTVVRRHSFQASRGALQRVASTKGVTGTAVITMKACRASMEVLSPRPEPMRSSTKAVSYTHLTLPTIYSV